MDLCHTAESSAPALVLGGLCVEPSNGYETVGVGVGKEILRAQRSPNFAIIRMYYCLKLIQTW